MTLANHPSNFNHSSYQHLPPELTQSGRFCCWRYAERNGRRTKLPFNPSTGTSAKSNSPATFVDFPTAVRMSHAYDGIGIGIFDGISAIDLDHCVTDSGCLIEPAATIVELMHSYTEYSPSGDGLHILFSAPSFQYDKEQFYIMNHSVGMEAYIAGATNKYLTVTGNRANDYPFGDRSQELLQVLERFMRRPNLQNESAKNSGVNVLNGVNSTPPPLTPALPDNELLFKALNGKNSSAFAALWSGDQTGYPSQSEADFALCSKLAFWTGCDAGQMDRLFRQSGLMRPKWDRRQSGTTYGAITLQRAIESCRNVYQTPHTQPPQPQTAPYQQDIPPCNPPPLPFKPLKTLQIESAQLPPFPLDTLPAVVKDYVEAVSIHSQTSVDMAATMALGVLAIALQRKFQVMGKTGYVEPVNLYTVIVAAPGERKSAVMRDMTSVISQYEQDYNDSHAQDLKDNRSARKSLEKKIKRLERRLESKEDFELEEELRDAELQLEELPQLQPMRFYADDCTPEALTSLLAEYHGVFSVLSTEGGIFDILSGRYSKKPNLDTWLKGYCGDNITVDRKGREPEHICNPTLSAVLTVQPSILADIMSNATMEGRGLLDRFLYCSPLSRVGHRTFESPPVAPDLRHRYELLVFSLMDIPLLEHPRTLTLSQQATLLFSDFFMENERYLLNKGKSISGWASKFTGEVLRLAGLLHVAEQPQETVIGSKTMHRAITIGRYFLAQAEFAYTQIANDQAIEKAQLVASMLSSIGKQTLGHYELYHACRGKFFKEAHDIDPSLELLQEHGYLRLEQPPSTGRVGRKPSIQIIVNPQFLPPK